MQQPALKHGASSYDDFTLCRMSATALPYHTLQVLAVILNLRQQLAAEHGAGSYADLTL
jgi:hypothetical protein